MQVDLFSDAALISESQRLGSQVESRKFTVVKNKLSKLPTEVEGFPQSAVEQYNAYINELVGKPRAYLHVGSVGCDNLWELEMLGLGEFSKKYTVCIDFSQALDYAMEIAFNCAREECRKIQNYTSVSRMMMNFDFTGASEKFGVLFDGSEELSRIYVKILAEINNDVTYANSTQDEKMSYIVFRFYSSILQTISNIKNYVATALQAENRGKIVYRSKTFSTVIMTSDFPIDEKLILSCNGRKDYEVYIRSYTDFAWAKERYLNEAFRRIF